MSMDALAIKVILVGDSGVGKSCLLRSYMGDSFDELYSTIGVDFEIKPIVIDGKSVNLQIWDTAGQERFRAITTSYYKQSDAVMLVFDVTDPTTFAALEVWYQDVRAYARPGVDVIVAGNKVDLQQKRVVDFDTAKKWAEERRMQYIETSASKGINVDRAFTALATLAAANATPTPKPTSSVPVTITPSSASSSSSGYCC